MTQEPNPRQQEAIAEAELTNFKGRLYGAALELLRMSPDLYNEGNSLALRLAGLTERPDYRNPAWLVNPELDQAIQEAAAAALRATQGAANGTGPDCVNGQVSARAWPEPPEDAAFHGLAGDLVSLIRPKTEADPVAILINILVVFGNMSGRAVYRTIDDARHHPNLFAAIAGATNSGRKGSAWSRVKRLGPLLDDAWAASRVQSGLSSGEGLIWAVRDPIETTAAIREKGRATGEYETFTSDQGVDDKRLLVVATEFASVLKVARRQGNTLLEVARQAWDGETLQILNKNSPAKATGAHVSMLAHITPTELLRYVDSTEAGNGFANRFLWICSRRARFLPIPVNILGSELAPVASRFCAALEYARTHPGERGLAPECRHLWIETYPNLARERHGMVSEILARGPTQVLRLALLYSILDSANEIRVEHLNAALALWKYAERSVEYLFGDRLGDPEADMILDALRSQPNGLTRTQINSLFGRHLSAARLEQALAVLLTAKLATFKEEPTSGRPIERWFATKP